MRPLVSFICIYLCFASPALLRCVDVAGEEEEEEEEAEKARAGEEMKRSSLLTWTIVGPTRLPLILTDTGVGTD